MMNKKVTPTEYNHTPVYLIMFTHLDVNIFHTSLILDIKV